MTEISPEELRDVLRYDPETGKLFWLPRDNVRPCWNGKHAGKEAFTYQHKEGYRVGTFRRTQLKAHRVAWAITFGAWPSGQIDHINGNRADNRLANLRSATPSQNSRNRGRRTDNQSGHTGVCWDNRDSRWLVQIMAHGRNTYVGTFEDLQEAIEAIEARKAAEIRYGYHPNHGADRSKASRRRLSKAAQERRT